MAYLPLANILHYRLRSALSALGIGVGICMLVTLSGLAHGTLDEIGDRWEAVDADLIVFPREAKENLVTLNGIGLPDQYVPMIQKQCSQYVQRVVPVCLAPVKLGGQDQTAVGVDSDQWSSLTGGRELSEGRLFDPKGEYAKWMETMLLAPQQDPTVEVSALVDAQLARRGGLEIVIDSRLAAKGKYTVGQVVNFSAHDWTIVGIVPAGAMSRVTMPRRTAQYLFCLKGINSSTMFFVKLRPGADIDQAAAAIRKVGYSLDVVPLRQYRSMLQSKWGLMFRFIDAVNVIAMIIAFLFIMVTLYMMVLQRTREIAILKSFGASSAFIIRQVLDEGLILTLSGAATGIGMSYFAAWMVSKLAPLYTVSITWQWLAIAIATAIIGAVVSSLYPAWRATRIDMVEALTLE